MTGSHVLSPTVVENLKPKQKLGASSVMFKLLSLSFVLSRKILQIPFLHCALIENRSPFFATKKKYLLQCGETSHSTAGSVESALAVVYVHTSRNLKPKQYLPSSRAAV